MFKMEPKSIYFVYQNTEFYHSQMKVLGTYFSKEEAIRRVETYRDDLKPVEQNVFGSFWRTQCHSYRYFIREFPLGDCLVSS
jgi:hypothetical protein